MALVDSDKYKIITLLGYPAKTIVTSSTHYNSLVADRLINLNDDIEAIIADKLDEIDEAEAKLTPAVKRAGIRRVGDIEFEQGGTELEIIRKEKRRLLKELATLLDIPYQSSGNMANVII